MLPKLLDGQASLPARALLFQGDLLDPRSYSVLRPLQVEAVTLVEVWVRGAY